MIASATATLGAAGVASPRVDAELLAAHVLGVPRGRLLMVNDVSAAQCASFEELVRRRAAREPLQHLTGTAPFRRLELAVGPGVFIPRPETESLVEWATTVAELRSTVVDLCSGSGAIALSIAVEIKPQWVYAVEADADALPWLRRNVATHAPEVRVIEGDATSPGVLSELDGTVDLVVSNPPYVPSGAPVPPEVAEHDPAVAVFGGPDGLAVIPALAARAHRLLRAGGWFGVEHDDTHGAAVPELLAAAGFTDISAHRDLAGRPRFTTAHK